MRRQRVGLALRPEEAAKASWEPLAGYLLALASAFIWANYSLQTKRGELNQRGFPSAAIGLFGLLSYLTPLASTTLLLLVTGRSLTWHTALAAALIIGAALLGTRKSRA